MNFILRSWNSDDLNSLVKDAKNFNIAKNLTNLFPHPYTIEHGKAFIEKANSTNKHIILAIEINGEAIGGIGLHPQTDIHVKNAELGYWLAEPFWGKGIITSAIIQIVEKGFNELEIERIFARPFGTNMGSQKVLEKAGFKLEARLEKTIFKNGEYLDELIYAFRRNK